MCHALGILMYVLLYGGGVVGCGASGEECCRELLEEGGCLWYDECVRESVRMEVSRGSLLLL